MNTSVGTKARKKQPALSAEAGVASADEHQFQVSLLSLENACMRILDSEYAEGRRDTEHLYWQQRLMNIAKPVSLALAEYKGPRHFHHHYRRRADDESIFHPVLENAADMLAQVCQDALKSCRSQLVGIQDEKMTRTCGMFENALQGFLMRCKEYKDK